MTETSTTPPQQTETISVPLIKTANNFLPENYTISFVRPELFKKTTQESSSNAIYIISSSLLCSIFLFCFIAILYYFKPEIFSFLKSNE